MSHEIKEQMAEFAKADHPPIRPPIPTEPMLETDPEVSAKRTAMMQQLAQPHDPQAFKGNLTIIWEDEKEMLQKRLASCEERLKVLETWAVQLKGWAERREPQLFMKAANPE